MKTNGKSCAVRSRVCSPRYRSPYRLRILSLFKSTKFICKNKSEKQR